MEKCVNTQFVTSSDTCNKGLKTPGNGLNMCQDNQWGMNPVNDMTMADVTKAVSLFITSPVNGHISPKKEPNDLREALFSETNESNEAVAVDNNTSESRSAQTTSHTNDRITEVLFSNEFEFTNNINSTSVLQCEGLRPTTYMDGEMVADKNTTIATAVNTSNCVVNRILQTTRSNADDIVLVGIYPFPTSAVDVSKSCSKRNMRSNTSSTRVCDAGINTQNTVIQMNKSNTSDINFGDSTVSYSIVGANNTTSHDDSADAEWLVEPQVPNDPKQHHCNVCVKTYSSLYGLESHMHSHTGAIHYYCKIGKCKCVSRFKSGFIKHTRKFHPGQPVIYSIKVIEHRDTSTCKAESRQFVCRVYNPNVNCDLTFSSKRQLHTHFTRNHKSEGFICMKCGKRFLKVTHLEQHDNVHKGIKPYKCKICGKKFHTNTEQHGHFRIHHVESKLIWQCEICGKVVKGSNVYDHKQSHLKRRYQCPECKDDFMSPRFLKDHMRMHRGEEKYKCDLCSQTFVQRMYLVGHLQRHNKRKYPCPKCDKLFTCKRFLKGHLLLHDGIKKHCCNVCGKTFAHVHYLFTHMKSHGEKRFECAICGGKFNRKDNLKSHIKRHQTTGRKNLKKR